MSLVQFQQSEVHHLKYRREEDFLWYILARGSYSKLSIVLFSYVH